MSDLGNLKDLAVPSDLSEQGRKAHEVLVAFLVERGIAYTGGCKAFYSPTEWKARGEEYGTESILVVVYDGGDHRMAFTLDEEMYQTNEAMQQVLEKLGLYFEECTSWYGAVYRR